MESIEFYIRQIKNNEDLENYLSWKCDIEFESKEVLDNNLKSLIEYGKCNYEVQVFACDGAGGVYVVLNNAKIGYIDSEGRAGIISNNIKDFFSIAINCGTISDYVDCLKDIETFKAYYNEIEIPRQEEFIKKFIKDNLLENESDKIYRLFKEAVISSPKLIIEATDEECEDSEQLFNL